MPSRRQKRRDLQRQDTHSTSISAHYVRAEGFLSPLPSANELRQLNEIVPDGAERAFRILEKQSDHRMDIEKMAIKGDTGRANLGLFCGFTVAMTLIAASYVLIINGYAVAGTILGTVDIVSLVTVFIYGSMSRRAERQEKTNIRAQAALRNKI